jgi:hypothetical protein
VTSAVQASVAAGYEQGNAGSSGVHPATNSSSVQVIAGPPGDMPVQPLHLDDDHVTPGGACGSGVISSSTANRTPGSE